MAKKVLTIDDLLLALQNPEAAGIKPGPLPNSRDMWKLIGERKFDDIADKVGIAKDEVNEYLREWTKDNPYSNIID